MGGNSRYYDRDVTDKRFRTSRGYSTLAERQLQQRVMDPALLPKDRVLTCQVENPLVYDFDVTGSMGDLPKIIYDKWPGIVGQIVARGYLPDAQMSIAATGDTRSDFSPLQMADFSPLRNLDKWLQKIHFEGNGGGQGSESYALTAYFYAYRCELPNARIPIYLITGDEAFVDLLYAEDLKEHFGGEHEDTDAAKVFSDLLAKFKDNVFLIHRPYSNRNGYGWTEETIVRQWQRTLGRERVIHLPDDLAVGDVTLGVYAVVSGSRTVEQYLEDMRTRPLDLGEGVQYEPQSEQRIRDVERALEPLLGFKPLAEKASATRRRSSKKATAVPEETISTEKSWKL